MPSTERYIPNAWEKVPCPFCGSTEFSIYERFGSELQFTYVLCGHCTLVYQSPRPKYDQHFIDSAYASYYQFSDNLALDNNTSCLLYTSPSPRDGLLYRMPSYA